MLATVEGLFGIDALTVRDRGALDLRSLASLSEPREVAADFLVLPQEVARVHPQVTLDALEIEAPPATRPEAPIEQDRNLPGFLDLAARTDRELPPKGVALEAHTAGVRDRLNTIRTRADARDYFEEVRRKMQAAEEAR